MSESRPSVFFLHRGNGAFLAKQTKRPRFPEWSIRDLIIMGVIFFATLIIALILLLPSWKRWYDLQNDSTSTQAAVTAIRFSDRDVDFFFVTFGFTATNGNFHEVEQQVSLDKFDLILANDQNLQVRYVTSDPQTAELTGRFADNSGNFRLPGTFVAIFLLVFWGGILALNIERRDRNSQLLEKGSLIKGYLMEVRNKKPQEDSTGLQMVWLMLSGWFWMMRRRRAQQFTVSVRYRFSTPDGEAIEKWESQIRNDLDRASLPPANTPVAVLFRNKRHFRML